MKAEDYYAERMKSPAFRAAVRRHKRYMRRWGWWYELQMWVEYIFDWVIERMRDETR